ncbi:MAG: hypothetical protein JWM87_2458 [Candidatus Eremiobacteraeota bacterium]|nr:hypothetical protein [Candidatus Eremiobacteraeota bacterium]
MGVLSCELETATAVRPLSDWDGFFVRCAGWMNDHADLFDLVNLEHEDWKSGAKAFGELVFLLMLLLRSERANDPQVRKLARFASERIDAFDWEAALSYYPNLVLILGYVARFCALIGKQPPLSTAMMTELLTGGCAGSVDYKPFRRADLLYGFGLAGVPVDREQLAATLRGTALLESGEAALFSFSEMYAITHAVFYLTDFGCVRPQTYATDDDVARVRTAMVRGLGIACREHHLDLIGEYLVCWSALEMPQDHPVRASAVAMLISNQLPDGAVPAFAKRRPHDKRSDVSARFRHWLDCYHTTLVCMLAASRLGDARG